MLHNKLLGWKSVCAVAAALLFGMTAVGCTGDPAGNTPAELNGTWIADEENDGIALVLSSGSFEIWMPEYYLYDLSDDGDDWDDDYYYNNYYYGDELIRFIKGSFSTSGNRVTLNPNQLHGDALNILLGFEDSQFFELLESKWYTRSALKSALKDRLGPFYTLGGGDKAVDQMYDEGIAEFTNTKMTYELDGDILYLTDGDGETAVFTKSPIPLRKSAAVKKSPSGKALFNVRLNLSTLKAALPSVEK